MKPTSFLTSLFFAAGVFAAPYPDVLPQDVQPGGRLQRTRGASLDALRKRNPSMDSTNWAGAFLPNPPAGETFESAVAQVTLPAAPGKGESVAIWVGIDGVAPGSPLIQGGVLLSTGTDGTTGCWAWTEWVPDLPVYELPSKFGCKAGDTLTMAVTVEAGATTAKMTIDNDTTGAPTWERDFEPTDKTNKAQGLSAEWVVEQADGTTISNFGSISFTDAGATTSAGAGHEVNTSGATTVNLKQQNQPITATGSLPADDEVKITYNGL